VKWDLLHGHRVVERLVSWDDVIVFLGAAYTADVGRWVVWGAGKSLQAASGRRGPADTWLGPG
jgi:hypothetical protein